MNRLRLRNAARVKASIEQLGRNWVLHPDHAVTAVAHAEVRAARTETVDTRDVYLLPLESPALYIQQCGRVHRDKGPYAVDWEAVEAIQRDLDRKRFKDLFRSKGFNPVGQAFDMGLLDFEPIAIGHPFHAQGSDQ